MPDPSSPAVTTALTAAATALGALNAELSRMKSHADALLVDDPELRRLLLDYAVLRRDMAAERAETRDVEGGIYGPNGTEAQQARWGELARRDWKITGRLHAVVEAMLVAEERKIAEVTERTHEVAA